MRGSLAVRWAHKVKVGNGCWEWVGGHGSRGYGRIRSAGRLALAHRVAHELFIGPIPDGLFVCHRCDNRGCVRPAHLFAGTQKDNMRDMAAKGRCGFTRHPDTIARGERHPSITHPERVRRGERHPCARLSEKQVRDIRRRVNAGETQAQMVREFGVAQNAVYQIVRRLSWAHLED